MNILNKWKSEHPEAIKEHNKTYVLKHKTEERICVICGKKFRVIRTNLKHLDKSRTMKTCSKECCKIRNSQNHKNWEKLHPQRIKDRAKEYHQNLKFSVMAIYSEGQPKCACCGTTWIEFLSIDHINNDGAKHRRELYGNRIRCGYDFYKWLKDNDFPEGFRVLCMSCNHSYGHFGYCPHNFK